MEKKIQIPLELFETMVAYIQDHFDALDSKRYNYICRGVENKRQAEIKHNLYSAYKAQTNSETREILRHAYLDQAGIPSHGRWDAQGENQFRQRTFND